MLRRHLLVLVLACGALVGMPARAEEDEGLDRLMPFAVRETNRARFAVKEIRRLLADGRAVQGLRLAQRVLDEMPDDFFRVATPEASTRWRLASEHVRDVLATLSPDERETYDRLSRPSTRPLTERALRHHDTARLAEVATRFGASEDGRGAARLLSDLALEGGRPRVAAWWAREGLRYDARDAGLWLRLVDALAAAGDSAAPAGLEVPEGLALPGGEGDAATVASRVQSWRRAIPPPSIPSGWPMWNGNAARSARLVEAGPRPESLRWAAPVLVSRGALDIASPRGNWTERPVRFQAHWRSFCPLHPVVRGRTAYVADGRSVRALDLYSGRPFWVYDRERERGLSLISSRVMGRGRTSFERHFSPVLWHDLVLATVEVSGKYDGEMLQGVEITTYLPQRRLVALDAQDGRRIWSMGMHEEDAAALEGLSAVSPCVVSEGLAIVVAARHDGLYRIRVLAFDARTGRLVWQRSLGVGQQELNLFGAPVKELAAAAPAVADGILYVSTGLGFMAALDLRTGRPEWLASYPIQKIEAVDVWYTAPLRFPLVAPSPLVVHGDAVLLAPTDGKHLHAYARQDGRLLWRVPYPGSRRIGTPAQFLGTAYDGRRDVAILTGADVYAYDLADGQLAWMGHLQDEYEEHNVVVGRGAVAAGHVLVPTTNGLVRFSVEREGSFEGRDPWPRGVDPGNVLPLQRVLLVSSRGAVQAFYSWDEIERDVARRRAAAPDDPTVLLEAGEIYRMGGAVDRARRAFTAALDVARGAQDEDGARRAEQGIFRAWLSESEAAVADDRPRDGRDAIRRALEWARSPHERVEARVRLDALLGENPDVRVENLERLADEALGVKALFPGEGEEVSARAMALLKLARVQEEEGRAAEAVQALQRLLREEGDASIRSTPAREHARSRIDAILRVWGQAVYRPFEEEARRLLERAAGTNDGDLLDRILDEYPNATVIPETLLRLGRNRAERGDPAAAADVLGRLLGEYPESPQAPSAAAALAEAFSAAGLAGATRFTWAWLEAQHPDTVIESHGKRWTGRSLAEAERRPPRILLPETQDALAVPLDEVLIEKVAEESWGRQVEVSTVERTLSPVALMSDARRLVAFDLVGAQLAFVLEDGPYHRAFYDDSILVLAAGRLVRGVTADRGETLWELDIEGSVLDLEGGPGLTFALLHDTRPGHQGERRILALDAARGRVLWSKDLAAETNASEISVHGPDLLVRETRQRDGNYWPAMLVIDGLTGRLRHVIGLPEERRTDREPLLLDGRLIVASRDARGTPLLTAHTLATGEIAWSRTLPGTGRVSALVPDDRPGQVVVLQEDGFLGTYATDDGKPRTRTRIYAGEGRGAWPFHQTALLVTKERVILMPGTARPPAHVGAWDRGTGKIVWDTPWEQEERNPGRSALALTDDGVLALTPYSSPRPAGSKERPPTRVLLRVLDRESGRVLQQVEPVGLAPDYGLVSLARGWGTVVVFGRAGVALYASAR